jgi:hypothetical protein
MRRLVTVSHDTRVEVVRWHTWVSILKPCSAYVFIFLVDDVVDVLH